MRDDLEFIETGHSLEDMRTRLALTTFFLIVGHGAYEGNPDEAMRHSFRAANLAMKEAKKPVKNEAQS